MATIAVPEPARPRAGDAMRGAAVAGLLAALLILFVQLLWRAAFSPPGVPSFPEMVVAAVARLTPLDLFGYATENFGPLAKDSLFVVILLVTLAVGYEAGAVADRWARSGRLGRGVGARIAAGVLVAAALLLATVIIIAPLGRYGFFALQSPDPAAMLTQLVVTFALFGLAWAWLADALQPTLAGAANAAAAPAETSESLTRRGVIGAVGVALLAGVGGLTWRLFQPVEKIDRAASEAAANDIVATAEARQAAASAPTPAAPAAAVAPSPTPVPTEVPPTAAPTVQATKTAAASATQADLALFKKLEAEGRLTPRLTAIADFYHVSKNISDPFVDSKGWSLSIGGMAEKPQSYTYDQLLQRATTHNITTLCCISNYLNGDLISTAEWTGIPLPDLLKEAGVDPKAVDLKLSAADGYEESFPLKIGLDPHTMLVLKMNGQPLPSDHGGPARLIVPPIYGMKNVKWIQKIEAINNDFMGYWEERGWSDTARYQIWGRFDTPKSGETTPAGPAVLAGLASAGNRGIKRVEISLDGGKT
ncbi:MAG TPA: molybdopterin-dependent oxidoreductase, partial [Thermomicrobiales bacterium]|nr:molybdopterin-dependent oxidoreductase [Thermomicrobiales bacterium]